jgi:hypothetical protein
MCQLQIQYYLYLHRSKNRCSSGAERAILITYVIIHTVLHWPI